MKTVKLMIDFYNSQAGDVIQMKDHSAADFVRRGWAVYVQKEVKKDVKKEPKKGKK